MWLRPSAWEVEVHRDRWVLRGRNGGSQILDPLDLVGATGVFKAVLGKRRRGSVTLVVPLGSCFIRETVLPRAMLGQATAVLLTELEANTPFEAGTAYWDWFAHGPGRDPGTVQIRQLVLKRRDLARIQQALAAVPLTIRAIAVDDPQAAPRRLPVDLLRADRGDSDQPSGLRRVRQIAITATCLAGLAVVPVAFARQTATLAALDAGIDEATDKLTSNAGPGRAPLAAVGSALAAKRRNPPAALVIDTLAGALPRTAYLEHLFLDGDVVTIQGRTGSMAALMRALTATPMFIVGHDTANVAAHDGAVPFTIRLKIQPSDPEADT